MFFEVYFQLKKVSTESEALVNQKEEALKLPNYVEATDIFEAVEKISKIKLVYYDLNCIKTYNAPINILR